MDGLRFGRRLWQRYGYDLRNFSQEHAATEIETLSRHVMVLRRLAADGGADRRVEAEPAKTLAAAEEFGGAKK